MGFRLMVEMIISDKDIILGDVGDHEGVHL